LSCFSAAADMLCSSSSSTSMTSLATSYDALRKSGQIKQAIKQSIKQSRKILTLWRPLPKNRGVCKKLELNILKINWALAILSLKKIFEFFFNLRKWSRWGKLLQLSQILRHPQFLFSTWLLMNPFYYKLVNYGSMSPRWGQN